jgi:hypothetical protein
MKKLAVTLSMIALALTGGVADAWAQDYEGYYEDERPGIAIQVQRGGPGPGGGRFARVAALELQHLNRELHRTRDDIRTSRFVDRRVHWRFQRISRAAAELNVGYRRGVYRPREVWSQAQQLRGELRQLRRALRVRGGGPWD